jgi:UDP-glucose 4-epimerase
MILVTGGAGYIGSHTCVTLAAAGYDTVVLDDFSNARRSVRSRLAKVVGRPITFHEGDVGDVALVQRLLATHQISAVVHFAAFKAVGESVKEPLRYYKNNVGGTMALLQAMRRAGVGNLVFSSSATVYGNPNSVPIQENFPLLATNPYGWTKLLVEQLLADVVASEPEFWRVARLRYFNPVGAHPSGLIGEDPRGEPNNLLPFVAQVAMGARPFVNVWGDDYPTPDGTGVRDYIHVMDLAEGHVAALEYLQKHPGLLTVNLGTGRGTSVLEMIRAFNRGSGKLIPYQVAPRRPGDVAECWADPSLAQHLLGWRATRSIDEICIDAWRWQQYAAEILKGSE